MLRHGQIDNFHCPAGNTNTLAGNVPPKADLGDLRGLAAGLDGRHASMINGGDFDGAKAYKDSKVPVAPLCTQPCSRPCLHVARQAGDAV